MATKQVWAFGASGASVSVPEEAWGRYSSGERRWQCRGAGWRPRGPGNHPSAFARPRLAALGSPAPRRSPDLPVAAPASSMGLLPDSPPARRRRPSRARRTLCPCHPSHPSADQAYVVLAPGDGEGAQQRLYLWAGDDAHKVRGAGAQSVAIPHPACAARLLSHLHDSSPMASFSSGLHLPGPPSPLRCPRT